MRERRAANEYRKLILLLSIALLVCEVHLGLSEIRNIGRYYQRVKQGTSAGVAANTASTHNTADAIQCSDYTIEHDACPRELLDSSQNLVLHGAFLRTTRKTSKENDALCLFLAVSLSFSLAAARLIRCCCSFYWSLPSGELADILNYIHELDGKK